MKDLLRTHGVHIALVIVGMAIVAVPSGVYIHHLQSNPASVQSTIVATSTSAVATSTPAQVLTKTVATPADVITSVSFAGAGTVKNVAVVSGTNVSEGEVVFTISRTDLTSQLASAKKTLASAQATLAKATSSVAPVSPGDQNSLLQAQNSLRTAIRNAYIESNDAVANKSGQFFSGVGTASVKLTFSIPNSQLSTNLANTLPSLLANLSAWQKQINASPFNSATNTAPLASNAETVMNSIPGFLTNLSTAISEAASFSSSAKSSDESTISAAQLNINNALSAVVAAQDDVQAVQATIAGDQKSANSSTIQADQAAVTAAQNVVNQLQAEMTQTVKAPIAGVIAVKIQVGEAVSTSTVLATITSSK